MFFVDQLVLSYNLKKFSNILFFRDFNRISFFSDNTKVLSVLNKSLEVYMVNKNLRVFKKQSFIGSTYSGFSFLNRFFYKDLSPDVFFTIDHLSVKKYKCKLRMIVKNFNTISCLELIKSLNIEINKWHEEFKILASFRYIANSLDFYLYKLVWKWCKRFHPRRPNLWIFEKYWKKISRTFRFFSIDTATGKFSYLKSHSSFYTALKRLPNSVSVFDYRDKKKIFSDLFKKARGKFYGIYGILFDNQKGICPRCNSLLIYYDSQLLRIVKLPSPISSVLVLVHAHCKAL